MGAGGLWDKQDLCREGFREPCASLMAWGPLVAGETGIRPGLAGLLQPILLCLPAAQPGLLSLGPTWVCEGHGVGTRWIWSMEAELVSPFFLSDSKGSLEPHKPGEHPAEIAALTHLLNISS